MSTTRPRTNPARLARRQLTIVTAAALLLVLGLLAALPESLADSLSLPITCPWRLMTGISCPGCGGTRALACLAARDIAGAMDMNPPLTLATLGTILLGASSIAAPAAADRLLDGLAAAAGTRRARLGLAALLLAQMVFGPR